MAAPKLAANYGGQNSWMPYGWGLTGVSVIERCNGIPAIDGKKTARLDKPTDKLCLNGLRLIPTTATGGSPAVGTTSQDSAYSASGAFREFRTEVDSYVRVRSFGGTAESGPEYFRVWTKDGQVQDFGNSPNADGNTQANVKPNGVVTSKWLLSSISDEAGNIVKWKYSQRSPNWGSQASVTTGLEWYPIELQYSGNKVVFSYSDRASSSPQASSEVLQLGAKLLAIAKLDSVTTYVNSPNTASLGPDATAVAVKTYKFATALAPVTKRLRLTSISECAGGPSSTKCKPATEFTYTSGGTDEYVEKTNFSLANEDLYGQSVTRAILADFNGDGKTDILKATATTISGSSNLNVVNTLFLSKGDGTFTTSPNFNLTGHAMTRPSQACFQAIVDDFNGDGLPDILRYSAPYTSIYSSLTCTAAGTPPPTYLFLNNGDGSFTAKSLAALDLKMTTQSVTNVPGGVTANEAYNFYVIDADGDGILDIVSATSPAVANFNTQTSAKPCLSRNCTKLFKGDGSGGFSEIPTNLANVDVYDFPIAQDRGRTADIDGDGLLDLFISDLGGRIGGALWGARSRGDGNFDLYASGPVCSDSATSLSMSYPTCTRSLIDYNGDGRVERLMPRKEPGDSKLYAMDAVGSLSTAVSNFNLTGPTDQLLNFALWGGGTFIADFNLDGRQDILRWRADPAENRMYISNGDGTFVASSTFNGSSMQLGQQASTPQYVSLLADFLGTGTVQILRIANTATGSQVSDPVNRLYVRKDSSMPDRLVSVKSQLGAVSSVDYVPLGNPTNSSNTYGARYVSDRGTSNAATGTIADSAAPMPLVATLYEDTGVGSTKRTTQFQYRGLKVSKTGRGLLGFREVRQQSTAADGTVVTKVDSFASEYPYNGRATSKSLYKLALTASLTEEALLSATTFLYCDQMLGESAADSALGSGVACLSSTPIKRPYVLKEVTRLKDLAGAQLPTTTRVTRINGSGTPTSVSVSNTLTGAASDTFTSTITNEFQSDETSCVSANACSWEIGRVSKTVERRTAPSTMLATSAGAAALATATSGTIAFQRLSAVSFGDVQAGASVLKDAVLSNDGTTPLSVTVPNSSSVSGSTAFSFVSTTCGTSLAAGANCLVKVKYAPLAIGAGSGTVKVVTGVGTLSAALTGNGVAPSVAFTPVKTAWGVIGTGSDSGDWPVLKNNSPSSIKVTAHIKLTGPASAYAYQGNAVAGTCLVGTTVLAPGASCKTFFGTGSQTTAGAFTGSNQISYQVVGNTAVTYTKSISYSWSMAGLSVTPTSINFGQVSPGLTSASRVLTVKNEAVNGGNLNSLAIALTGADTADFPYSTTCGSSLAPSGTCTITVSYDPEVADTAASASFAVSGKFRRMEGGVESGYQAPHPGPSVSAPLSGYSVAFSSTISSLDFGSRVSNSGTFTLVSTVKNTSLSPITVVAPTASSVSGAGFAFSSTNCGGSLASTATCSVWVTFTPTGDAVRTGTLTVNTGAAGVVKASLTGRSQGGTLTLTPSTIVGFGRVPVGTTRDSQPITLKNTGTGPAVGLVITSPYGFSRGTSSTCVAGQTLESGASCVYVVRFRAPEAGITYAGSVQFSSQSAGAIAIAVSGTGVSTGTTIPTVIPNTTTDMGVLGSGSDGGRWVTITNTTAEQLTVSSISMPNDGIFKAQYAVPEMPESCSIGQLLAPGAACQVLVLVQTAAPGDYAGRPLTVVLTTNGGTALTSTSEPFAVKLRQVEGPSSISFAASADAAAREQTLTFTNLATDNPYRNVSVGLKSDTGGAFKVVSETCSPGVEPGGSCQVTIAYLPSTVGTHSGILQLNGCRPRMLPEEEQCHGISSKTVALSGELSSGYVPNGVQASADVGTDMGELGVGSGGGRWVTLTNGSTSSVRIVAMSIPSEGTFEVSAGDEELGTWNCYVNNLLAPGDSCKAFVRLATLAPGNYSDPRTLVFDLETESGNATRATLGGFVVKVRKVSSMPQSVVAFTPMATGALRTLAVSVLNAATDNPLRNVRFEVTDDPSGSFTVEGETCNGDIPGGASCIVTVGYAPQAPGSHAAVGRLTGCYPVMTPLEEECTGPNLSLQIALTGERLVEVGQVTLVTAGGSPNLGTVGVGSSSGRILALQNQTAAPIVVMGSGMADTSGSFTVTQDGVDDACYAGRTVEPGEVCALRVTIGSLGVGQYPTERSVSVQHSAGVASLGGFQVSVAAISGPTQKNFGTVNQDEGESSVLTFVNDALDNPLRNVAVALDDSTGFFSILEQTCDQGVSGGSSCSVKVAYRPQAVGVHTASLQLQGCYPRMLPQEEICTGPMLGRTVTLKGNRTVAPVAPSEAPVVPPPDAQDPAVQN